MNVASFIRLIVITGMCACGDDGSPPDATGRGDGGTDASQADLDGGSDAASDEVDGGMCLVAFSGCPPPPLTPTCCPGTECMPDLSGSGRRCIPL